MESNSTILIRNGSTVWIYDKEEKIVTKMIGDITSTFWWDDYGKIVENLPEKFNVKLLGNGNTPGRDCYIFEIASNNSDNFVNQTIWGDKEHLYPVKGGNKLRLIQIDG
jgi:outer membrane lipoprotein-sorting protein